MYCPKCSHQQHADSVHFCSRCGFQLDAVSKLLATEDAGAGAPPSSLRQIDITLGAGLMLVGVIKAALASAAVGGSASQEGLTYLFVLTGAYALLMLLFQLSHRQRGLSLGATLMLIGALLAVPAAEIFGGAGILLVAAILFPLILFWLRLARPFVRFFFEKEPPALLPAPSPQVVTFTPQCVNTADMMQPPSVTEHTTKFIEGN